MQGMELYVSDENETQACESDLDMGMNSGSRHTLQVWKYFKKNDKATFSLWPWVELYLI